jgi:hypothetical protein
MWSRSSTSARRPKAATETEARRSPNLRIKTTRVRFKAALLRRAVGSDQAGVPNRALRVGAGNTQARGFEIRPGLLRAVAPDGADVQPITLGKGVRHAGFDLWSKSRKNGESGSDERSNSDGCKSFDHDDDDPHNRAVVAPRSWLTGYKAPVSGCLRRTQKWFRPNAVLFHHPLSDETKPCRPASLVPRSGSMAYEKRSFGEGREPLEPDRLAGPARAG